MPIAVPLLVKPLENSGQRGPPITYYDTLLLFYDKSCVKIASYSQGGLTKGRHDTVQLVLRSR